MNLMELVALCAERKIKLGLDGANLRVRAPAGALTPELQALLRQHKEALIGLLQSQDALAPLPKAPSSASGDGMLEVSSAQRSLWFLHQAAPESVAAYNLRRALHLEGALDLAQWTLALEDVVARHESLRTSFRSVDGRPVAKLEPTLRPPLELVDLSALDPEAQEAEFQRLYALEGRHAFDLTTAPLFRTTLLRLSPRRWYFLLNAHHMIADAVSAGIILRDMVAAYQERLAGGNRTSEASPYQYQYSDFVHWQQQRVQRREFEPAQRWWAQQLERLPTLELPVDTITSGDGPYDGASESFVLPDGVSEALRSLSQAEGVSLFTTVLASFAAFLSRITGQGDFPLGTSIAGRPRPELANVTGFFAEMLVLRMELEPDIPFRTLIKNVDKVKLEAFEHQDVPFERVVKAARPHRSLGQNPLFNVLFLYLQSELEQASVPGLQFRDVQTASVTSKFDLSLHVEEVGPRVRGLIEYKTALFRRETILHLLSGWLELLGAAAREPSRPIGALPILTPKDRAELLYTRNLLQPAGVEASNLAAWFSAQASRTPDRVAVTFGDETLTYLELEQRSNRLARVLRARGVKPEVRVGLLLPRSIDMVVSILAVLKAGGAYVPVDPGDPPARLTYILEDSQVALIITDRETGRETGRETIVGLEAPLSGREVLELDDALAEIDAQEVSPLPGPGAHPLHAAYVIYTSGSTGKPKGVVIPHQNVMRLMRSTEGWFNFGTEDVWTLFHSYAFDFSVWEIWGALLYGGRLVIVPKLISRSPEDFLRLLAEEGVTVLNQTPTAFRSLVALKPDEGLPALALRFVIFGGEALEPSMLKPWIERYGDHHPQLINMYGITETTVHVTFRPITREHIEGRSGSIIGERIPDLSLYILDGQLQPVPEGVSGELYVGGAGLARGYLGRPGLTAGRFIPDPFSSEAGARLYRTGDLARWRPGADIEYRGRSDQQVKIRGFRIELGEIESTLQQHEGVQECVVIARKDAQGQPRLLAYFVPVGSGPVGNGPVGSRPLGSVPPDPSELRIHCQKLLPSHMIPAAFVALEAWPLTRNGKLDREALPSPGLEDVVAKPAYVPPRNVLEQALAETWQQVLKLEQVGITDDFFALGGDSILMLEVLSRLGRRGIRSSVAQLYQYSRLEALAEALAMSTSQESENTSAALETSLPSLPSSGFSTAPFALVRPDDRAKLPPDLVDAYPLSQLQAGMFYEEQLHPEQALYHDIFSFHLRLPLNEAVWTAVIDETVHQHAALRTTFDFAHFSEPLQLVQARAVAVCRFEDIQDLSLEAQEQYIQALIDAEKGLKFENIPPLLRFYFVRRSSETTQIVFGFHHAILDGWSVALMFSGLLQRYLAALGRIPAAEGLEPPAIRFADFIALERASLNSEADRAFWLKAASGLPTTRLPQMQETPGGKRRIGQWSVELSEPVTRGLLRLGNRAGAPIKTVALAAHLRVLSLISGQSEVVTGLVTNGRPEGDGGERVLGLFLNTLPLREVIGSGTGVELVQRTFAAEREVLRHRRFPMATLKELVGRGALFETAFNFVHFHVYGEVMRSSGVEVLEHRVFEETDFPFLVQFSIYPGASRLGMTLIYDGSMYLSSQIETIAGYYARCLSMLAEAPDTDFRHHALLSDAERRLLLDQWGACRETRHVTETLTQAFRDRVRRWTHRTALSFEGQTLTYEALDKRSDRIVLELRAQGVGPGTLVGLCLDRSFALVEGLLGILKAGGAYVPLDPAYPTERLAFMIGDSGVTIVLTNAASRGVAQTAIAQAGSAVQLMSLDRDIPAQSGAPSMRDSGLNAVDALEGSGDRAAYVIYTSGSTGRPKGVVVTHANVMRLFTASDAVYTFGEEDVWTLFHSYAFDFSVWELWGALLYGGRLVIVPYAVSRSPAEFHRLLEQERVTVLNQTPSAFYALMGEDEARSQKEGTVPLALRYVIFGGEALNPGRLRSWIERRGDASPELVNMYGITETTVHVTHRRVRRADLSAGVGSVIGLALNDLSLRVLDDQQALVPVGVAGELYVGGAGVARGYLNRDALTASRFVPDPFGPGRLYRTGDLVRWRENGELEYLGRLDNQVKVRGFRIELGEIEHLLCAEGGLHTAVALVMPGASEQPQLVAYGVASADRPVTVRALRALCEARLPDYMVPAAYVLLDALPLTPNGKLDRDALPRPDAEAMPQRPYVAPRDALERELCAIWEQVLGVTPIGIRQSFFELGGHSLNVVQIVSRIREQLAVNVTLRDLFEEPTVENLAQTVLAQRAASSESAPVAARIIPAKRRRVVELPD